MIDAARFTTANPIAIRMSNTTGAQALTGAYPTDPFCTAPIKSIIPANVRANRAFATYSIARPWINFPRKADGWLSVGIFHGHPREGHAPAYCIGIAVNSYFCLPAYHSYS